MYLSIHPNQFNIHYVMLSEKTKNNVMDNGDFFRLYYSDNLKIFPLKYRAYILANGNPKRVFLSNIVVTIAVVTVQELAGKEESVG